MSLEQAIHEVINDAEIADAVALLALLPADRITTGQNHEQDLPYASINIENDRAEYRSSSGAMREATMRFQLWHDNHATGIAIREAAERLFENRVFTTTQLHIETRHENTISVQEEDGTWQFLIDVEVKYRPTT